MYLILEIYNTILLVEYHDIVTVMAPRLTMPRKITKLKKYFFTEC